MTRPHATSVLVPICAAAMVLFVVYLFSPNHGDMSGDSFLVVPTAHSILYQGNLDLSEFSASTWYGAHYAQVEVNGRNADYFPWLTAVFTVPAVAAADLVSVFGPRPTSAMLATGTARSIQAVTSATIAALAAAALGLLTRELFGMSGNAESDRCEARNASFDRWAVAGWILTIGLGSSLWSTASRALWQHGPSILLGSGAMIALLKLVDGVDEVRSRRLATACGALLALAYWERPVNLALSVTALIVVWALRRDALLRVVAGAAAVHATALCLNLLWLGTPWPPYFAGTRIGYHDSLFNAAAADLVSPSRGLIIFSPFLLGAAILLLPSRRRGLGRPVRVYCLAAWLGSLLYLLAAAAYGEKWWAGHSFGPRFMSESLILLGPLALLGLFGARRPPLRSRFHLPMIGICLVLISIGVNLGGATQPAAECWNSTPDDVDHHPQRVWDWSDSQALAAYLNRSSHQCGR